MSFPGMIPFHVNGQQLTNPDILPPVYRAAYESVQRQNERTLLCRDFRDICSGGDTMGVAAFIDDHDEDPDLLSRGLEEAVIAQRSENVKLLLSRGAVINDAVSSAVANAPASSLIVGILQSHGWDINTPIHGLRTVLMANLDNEELVKWLLDNGADVYHEDRVFRSEPTLLYHYLHQAAYKASITTFDLLFARTTKVDRAKSVPLHFACRLCPNRSIEDSLSMMSHLVKLGFDVNGGDTILGRERSGTPLHHAIQRRHTQAIKFLLEHGADPNIVVDGLPTPITFAMGGISHVSDLSSSEDRELIILLKSHSGQSGLAL